MTDRPIIFSAPMILALLAGRKTQTRRVLRLPKWASTDPGHIEFAGTGEAEVICRDTGCLAALPLPYAVGDRLWVREKVRAEDDDETWDRLVRYLADDATAKVADQGDNNSDAFGKWWSLNGYRSDDPDLTGGKPVPSIHMPRWASRLTLPVTEVRVERLHDISEADAIAEGMPDFGSLCEQLDPGKLNTAGETAAETASRLRWPQRWFAGLWNSIHGPEAWAANPWVVAVTFDVHRANIDDLDAGRAAA